MEFFNKGRHNGKTFDWVFENDKEYTRFLFESDGLTGCFQEYQTWLELFHMDEKGNFLVLDDQVEYMFECLKVNGHRIPSLLYETFKKNGYFRDERNKTYLRELLGHHSLYIDF